MHYWHGSKLLWADIMVAWGLTRRLMKGETLTRREHKQVREIYFICYIYYVLKCLYSHAITYVHYYVC